MKLDGKVAIVTGAGAGIGEATARLFAREGARVCCNSITGSAGRVAEEIRAGGGSALFVQGDVSREEEARRIVEGTAEAYGRIDVLCTVAGIVVAGAVDETSLEDFDRCMAVNVRGVFLCSRFAIPHLRATRGAIVHCSSVVALKGVASRAAYSASKGAVLSLTRAMAADHMRDRIRVNAVCPGTIDTPSLAVRLAESPDPEEARRRFVARQPIGRFGTSEEIAEGILLLATNEFLTGAVLTMDGGMSV